jgi:hypothetical protein
MLLARAPAKVSMQVAALNLLVIVLLSIYVIE